MSQTCSPPGSPGTPSARPAGRRAGRQRSGAAEQKRRLQETSAFLEWPLAAGTRICLSPSTLWGHVARAVLGNPSGDAPGGDRGPETPEQGHPPKGNRQRTDPRTPQPDRGTGPTVHSSHRTKAGTQRGFAQGNSHRIDPSKGIRPQAVTGKVQVVNKHQLFHRKRCPGYPGQWWSLHPLGDLKAMWVWHMWGHGTVEALAVLGDA